MQPKFISTGRNDRLDVIIDMSIKVEPLSGGPAVDFTWSEQGAWSYDPTVRKLTYNYLADAGPLMVSPSNPQFPVGLFIGPSDWKFQPGEYRLTITTPRAIGSAPPPRHIRSPLLRGRHQLNQQRGRRKIWRISVKP